MITSIHTLIYSDDAQATRASRQHLLSFAGLSRQCQKGIKWGLDPGAAFVPQARDYGEPRKSRQLPLEKSRK
jgi:hypothetical protein